MKLILHWFNLLVILSLLFGSAKVVQTLLSNIKILTSVPSELIITIVIISFCVCCEIFEAGEED